MKDERYKYLMKSVGMPNSKSLLRALRQAVLEATIEERERCAKICETERYTGYVPPEDGSTAEYYNEAAENCAEAIRNW